MPIEMPNVRLVSEGEPAIGVEKNERKKIQ